MIVSYIHKYFRDDKQFEEIIPCSDSLSYPSFMRDLKVAFVYHQTNDSLSLVIDEIIIYSVGNNTGSVIISTLDAKRSKDIVDKTIKIIEKKFDNNLKKE